jgi:Methyltransferase domain
MAKADDSEAAAGGFWRPPDRYRTGRRFDYDRSLLPSAYVASLEPDEVTSLEEAVPRSGMTIGYPAWNLLYYTLFTGLPTRLDAFGPEPAPVLDDIVVVETGTNRGASTIVMAQALADLRLDAVVQSVERDERRVEAARENVERAGLADHVRLNVGDSLAFLRDLVAREPHVDFVFLDDHHTEEHVLDEVAILYPKLLVRRGKIYFDNTSVGGVAEALRGVKRKYGGNLIEFPNCSALPPGNAIWQPD